MNACIEIGTSCMLSLRRCAVTVISCSVSVLVSAAVAGASAYTAPPETPLKIAAIAHDSFGFEFMTVSPDIFNMLFESKTLRPPSLRLRAPDRTSKIGRRLIRTRHDPV